MMHATCFTQIESPLGPLLLLGDGTALSGLYMQEQKHRPRLPPECEPDPAPFAEAVKQLRAYFSGRLVDFDLPLVSHGTAFQQRVWQYLRRIPYGTTETYRGLAGQLGAVNASRAVGAANSRNPLSIIVPCHRVVGCSGALTGYAGGLDRKHWLLAHEQQHARSLRGPAQVRVEKSALAQLRTLAG